MKWNSGDALMPFRIETVSPDDMKVWAMVLHDPNPIHLDQAAVALRGLGNRRINQGPANLGYILNMLMTNFNGAAIEKIDVRFVDNVFENDTVEAAGRILEVNRENGSTIIACEVWLRRDGCISVLTGVARVRLESNI